ncbi:hypothetical protein [uncultured Roseobacter sp.]|uniref:hypothetical protein n=1 Tax=uncultured Roseobacter sp. TaxID=114847 RepID=UPI00260C8A2F|nr:hypothetical protein [uncultured Roseobacter sp.]
MRVLSTAKDDELNRYLCKDRENTFLIGHGSGVVSFYSQQCRAFHLATLLTSASSSSQKDKLRIAVLGGGVAGVTVWTALRELGFSQTHIFEATNRLLSRQQDSIHRHAHPCINEWPLLGSGRKFSSSTKWPFLNWYGGTASSVSQQLRSDPTFLYHLHSAPDYVHELHTVTRISEFEHPLHKRKMVEVGYRAAASDDVQEFDLVICALGYGYERDIEFSASKSYWWTDHVANYVRDRHEFANESRFVSGTGDGGLIDVVRLSAAPGTHPTTNIALQVVSAIRAPEFTILDNEWPAHEHHYSPIESALIEHIKTNGVDEESIRAAFRDLFQSIEFKSHFANDEDLKKVFLISRDGTYLGSNASFVNQVLVTYLKARHPELIVTGEMQDGKVMQLQPPKQLCDQADDRGRKRNPIKIVRHGAEPKVNDVVGAPVEASDKKNADSVLHDNSPELSILREGKHPAEDGRIADTTLMAAQAYCDTYFDGAICEWSPDFSPDNPALLIRIVRNKYNNGAYRNIGGFDRELFGVPLMYQPLHDFEFEEESVVDA